MDFVILPVFLQMKLDFLKHESEFVSLNLNNSLELFAEHLPNKQTSRPPGRYGKHHGLQTSQA